MRIDPKKQSSRFISTNRLTENRKVVREQEKEFSDVLEKQQSSNWKGQLDEILVKLDEIGKRLVKNFSIYDLREYKETLKHFLQETHGKAYGLKEEKAYSKYGRLKIYRYLERIDIELEELSNLVLAEQKDSIKILQKLDHIRGILIDLYT